MLLEVVLEAVSETFFSISFFTQKMSKIGKILRRVPRVWTFVGSKLILKKMFQRPLRGKLRGASVSLHTQICFKLHKETSRNFLESIGFELHYGLAQTSKLCQFFGCPNGPPNKTIWYLPGSFFEHFDTKKSELVWTFAPSRNEVRIQYSPKSF